MLPVHTILHPTDFSPESESAFNVACALARDYDARLLVLHVRLMPTPVYADAGVMIPPEPPGTMEHLRDVVCRLRPHDPTIPVEHHVEEGDPATEILQLARDRKCDLVVMGTHGRTGLRRLLMGSVAEEVSRRAPCPVLTVKAPVAEVDLTADLPTREATPV